MTNTSLRCSALTPVDKRDAHISAGVGTRVQALYNGIVCVPVRDVPEETVVTGQAEGTRSA